ncbi:ABC transporter substrate-binding protein [Sporosarcina limicola]|uniref:ABC-type nitrate/sulfonate/bicarbonate transport system substrate-binding protein n=1 Tax=Sporosarcina limicola TaxID=34101 RepID=A0A927RE24_9BACL|nr:ABC transporter substrate-binding protein [Sporosarcina limicola]MBE1555900.1 ABC-type nitrate/sulfonate/bicarbonate transport system substrate-binding protein [Sporosarcina limicola]
MKKVWLFVLLTLLLTACSSEPKNESGKGGKMEKIHFALDWTPNTNHTGLYIAQEKDYFKEAGLDVEIMLPGEAGADHLVASGKAQFGIGAQESITEARVQDIPIVSIAAILQHNTSGFASIKKSGIKSPKNYEGKTYGGWGAPVEQAVISSLMTQENADVDKVKFISMGNSDFFTAVERDIDFAWIYYAWTGIEAELRGIDLNMQYLKDYSDKLDYYTPVIITNEKMISDNPDTVQAFIKAIAKGYEFAIDNPEEGAKILLKAVPDLDEKLVKASQEWISPKYKDDAAHWGEQKVEIWENYANWMTENDLLDGDFTAQDAFTNKFLPK